MSKGSGEAHEAGLGGYYMGSVQGTRVGAQAADIDDGAYATSAKLWERRLDAIESAVKDDSKGITPVTLRHVLEGNFHADCCIVDENIDTAETPGSRRHHPLDCLSVGDVGEESKGCAPLRDDLTHNALRFFMVRASVHDHSGAGRCKFNGDCATDVSSGPSHDGDAPRKLLGVHGAPPESFGAGHAYGAASVRATPGSERHKEASYYRETTWTLVRYALAVGPRTEFGGFAGGIIGHVNFALMARRRTNHGQNVASENLLVTENTF
jgi:hypothetical protein